MRDTLKLISGGAEAQQAEDAALVIQIGFNRCGTLSFHRMLEASGIPSVHWKEPEGRNLAQAMVSNMAMGRKPFDGFEGIQSFSDMAYLDGTLMIEGARFFRELHAAYPKAYFFFNIRNKADWIASRAGHANGTFMKRFCKMSGLDETAAMAVWAQTYDTHCAEVEAYFATAEARFLRFDLDSDSPQKIADWLAPDYDVNTAHWGHYNRKISRRAHTAWQAPRRKED